MVQQAWYSEATNIHNKICIKKRNHIIMNMVLNMLTSGRLPKTLRPKVFKWSVHILNRSPIFVVKNITTKET